MASVWYEREAGVGGLYIVAQEGGGDMPYQKNIIPPHAGSLFMH